MASLAAQRFSAVLRLKRPQVVRPIRTYVAVALRNSVSRPTVLAKPAAVLLHRAQIATESETAKGEKVENNNNGNNTTALEGSPAAGIPPNFVSDMDGTGSGGPTDWSKSYHGLSSQAFSKEIAEILLSPVNPMDIEIKPDGLIYLPEIKYRRVLNKAFGPGAWGLAPRSQTNVSPKIVSREYALVCQGRLVAIARGEQEFFDPNGVATATEACKSNALMRCCKDLGIASELWDPRFIREFKAKHCVEVFVEHIPTKKKKKLWRRKDQGKFGYPYQE